MKNQYYVYALFRPWNLEPCYIGKGHGKRCWNHARVGVNHSNKHLAAIFKNANGAEIPCVILHEDLDERTAFNYEIALINAIGRSDLHKGPLCNQTNGGDGMSGWNPSDATRKKMSESAKMVIKTKEHIANVVKSRTNGAGWVVTENQKRKQSETMTGRSVSDETKKKIKNTMISSQNMECTLYKAKVAREALAKKRKDNPEAASLAAKKAWETRRKNPQAISESVKKIWEKRRSNKKVSP